MERFYTRDAGLIVGANLIPLAGVVFAGWDSFTLLMLYWFESAVIGLWVCVAVSTARQDVIELKLASGDPVKPGIGIALFIAAHAGIFMFVHLFFLIGFRSIGSGGPDDPLQLLLHLLINKGLWLPVAGLFVVRGLITLFDHRDGRRPEPTIVGFYLRIIIMQFAILAGGFFILIADGTLVPLILLIIMRAAIDLGIEGVSERITRALATQTARS